MRAALLWNDTRSARAARDLTNEFGAEELARRTGRVPVATFTTTKVRWVRDHEPENAAPVAAVALPHDWLSWRLRGYGPADESPLGPELAGPRHRSLRRLRHQLTGAPRRATTTASCWIASLGHDATLPHIVGPGESMGTTVAHDGVPAGILVGAGAGDNAAAALGLGARAGDVVVSIGTSGTVFAVTETPVADGTGTVAGFADRSGGVPASRRHPQRRARARPHGRRCSASTTPVSGELALAARNWGIRRPRAAALLRGRTHPQPARRHRHPLRHDARRHHPREPGARRHRGHAVRPRRRTRRRSPPRRHREPRAAGGRCGRATRPSRRGSPPRCSTRPSRVPEPGEYVALGATVQAAWALTGERPDVADRHRRGARARHPRGRSAGSTRSGCRRAALSRPHRVPRSASASLDDVGEVGVAARAAVAACEIARAPGPVLRRASRTALVERERRASGEQRPCVSRMLLGCAAACRPARSEVGRQVAATREQALERIRDALLVPDGRGDEQLLAEALAGAVERRRRAARAPSRGS